MTTKQYDYSNGPAIIQPHSIAKHTILQSYLAAYFQTLASSPNQEVLKLTLVDGFAGGGQYILDETGELVEGSPLILLDASKEAEFLINQNRTKPIKFDIDYFFVEKNKHAHAHLHKVLRDNGYFGRIGKDIHLFHSEFQQKSKDITHFIKKKTPKKGRSIFLLDQYGYKDVPASLIRQIFSELPSAEVILTFAVDALINFVSDDESTERMLAQIGIPDALRGKTIQEIKSSENDWRLFIQSALYRELVFQCGAKYFTPFFIRNTKGHGDYWLIHLSQHHKARDVMTTVHWDNNNHFIHYGGPGLDMLHVVGYDPVYDPARSGQQTLGFEFDDVARKTSVKALNEQIPVIIYADDNGLSFGELFATTCNETPATSEIYKESLGRLMEEKVIEIIGADGVQRRSFRQIKHTDQLIAPKQRSLFSI